MLKKKVRNIVLAWIWLIVSLLVLVTLANLPVRNRTDKEREQVNFLPLEDPLSFEITPKHDNFNIVELLFKNLNLVRDDRFKALITLSRKEGKDKKIEITRLTITGLNIDDAGQIRLQFPPQLNSANQIYEIDLEPKSLPKDKLMYLGFVEGSEEPKLATKIFYRSSLTPASLLQLIKERISFLFYSDPAFFTILFLLAGGLAFLI